jgi:hypothetical protein
MNLVGGPQFNPATAIESELKLLDARTDTEPNQIKLVVKEGKKKIKKLFVPTKKI